MSTKPKEPLIRDQVTVESAPAEGKHKQRIFIIWNLTVMWWQKERPGKNKST